MSMLFLIFGCLKLSEFFTFEPWLVIVSVIIGVLVCMPAHRRGR